MTRDGPIILFDGACGFCSRTVVFVVERDRHARFRFAPLQSNVGQAALRSAGLPTDDLDTVVLLDDGKVYTKSTASLKIAGGLRMPWRLLKLLLVVPRPIRDAVYDIVARNRHRILPGQDRCLIPAQLTGRVVESDG
jgi:predicted DCC family thiol-disulfide oxidoreductase YuxK